MQRIIMYCRYKWAVLRWFWTYRYVLIPVWIADTGIKLHRRILVVRIWYRGTRLYRRARVAIAKPQRRLRARIRLQLRKWLQITNDRAASRHEYEIEVINRSKHVNNAFTILDRRYDENKKIFTEASLTLPVSVRRRLKETSNNGR